MSRFGDLVIGPRNRHILILSKSPNHLNWNAKLLKLRHFMKWISRKGAKKSQSH